MLSYSSAKPAVSIKFVPVVAANLEPIELYLDIDPHWFTRLSLSKIFQQTYKPILKWF